MSFDIKEATSNRGQHKIWKIGWYSHNFNMGIVGATWNLLSIDNCDELVNSVVVIKYVAGSLSSIVHNHILQLLKVCGIVMFAEYAKGKITIGFLSSIIFSEPVVIAVLTILLPEYFVVTIRHAAHGLSMIVILLLFMMDRGSNLVVTRSNTVDMAAYDVLGWNGSYPIRILKTLDILQHFPIMSSQPAPETNGKRAITTYKAKPGNFQWSLALMKTNCSVNGYTMKCSESDTMVVAIHGSHSNYDPWGQGSFEERGIDMTQLSMGLGPIT